MDDCPKHSNSLAIFELKTISIIKKPTFVAVPSYLQVSIVSISNLSQTIKLNIEFFLNDEMSLIMTLEGC